tara:strand:- start:8390 stop:9574 length:1185 start_codon:yes stop_codon:yes gene_type:complete
MAELTENGILEYLESVRAPENAETFTEVQTGLGREGFRKFIPDPTQVADFLNFPKKEGLRTLAPEQGEPSIIRQILNKIPEHNEQAMADEYYGEYPEKTTDTAIGILSAFPAANMARLFGLMKSGKLAKESAKAFPNMLKDPAMKPFLQLLGLGGAKLDTGLKMRERIEAEEMADGGEIDPFSMLDPNPDLDSIPDTPKLDSIAKFFLPVTEEGELSKGDLAFEMASSFPMLFWMKGLKLGTKGYKQAGKIQDEIEDLKDLVTREKINAPTDGAPATNAVFRAQQKIGRKENELLRLVREQDPKYADLVEEASRRRIMDLTQKADPLYDNKIKSGIMTAVNQGGDELFDIAGNLKDPKYNKILEEGYRKNRNIANEGIGSLQKLIKDALTKKPD